MIATRTPGWPLAVVAIAVTLSTSVLAFVPSAKKELAALYPPLLRGDLSACSNKPTIAGTVATDKSKFVQRLQGTWELRSRTVRGITVNSKERIARLYFDMNPSAGSALLIDRHRSMPENELTPGDQAVAAFWTVGVEQKNPRLVALTMRGESIGSYTYARIRDLEGTDFFERRNVFVAIDRATPGASGWDKIVVTERSMTYVSCQQGIVELYAKLSARQPLVADMTLQDSWARLKARGRATADAGTATPASKRGQQ